MKKLLLSVLFLTGFLFSSAQFYNPYIQLEGGIPLDQKNAGMLCIEFGTSYKWLDVGISLDYESDSFFKKYNGEIYIFKDAGHQPLIQDTEFNYFENNSLQIVSSVDLLGLFLKESRHAFRVGGGVGIARYRATWSTENFPESSLAEYTLKSSGRIGFAGSLKASYTYAVNTKLSIGVYIGGTNYPSIGLHLRRKI